MHRDAKQCTVEATEKKSLFLGTQDRKAWGLARSNDGTARAQTLHEPPALAAIRFANWQNECVTRPGARREVFLNVSWCQVLFPPWLPASIWERGSSCLGSF